MIEIKIPDRAWQVQCNACLKDFDHKSLTIISFGTKNKLSVKLCSNCVGELLGKLQSRRV